MSETPEEPASITLDEYTSQLAEQGFGVVDNLPANHRLRAETLARLGRDEDPHGHVSRELIAETKVRLEAEDRDARSEAADKPSMAWLRDDLVEEAKRRGVAVETDANKAAILAAIEAHAAGNQEG